VSQELNAMLELGVFRDDLECSVNCVDLIAENVLDQSLIFWLGLRAGKNRPSHSFLAGCGKSLPISLFPSQRLMMSVARAPLSPS
jgi:hypothetical protein